MLVELSGRRLDSLSHASTVASKDGDVAASASEQQLALAMALRQLPSGTCLIVRDVSGREWSIKPARQASVIELRGAA